MNDFAFLSVRVQPLNSLLYSTADPALLPSARTSIGLFDQARLTDMNLDQSCVRCLIRDWFNPPANHIHLKRMTNV